MTLGNFGVGWPYPLRDFGIWSLERQAEITMPWAVAANTICLQDW